MLSFGTLSFIIVVVLVVDRNTVVALASAGISVVLASWGLARLTDITNLAENMNLFDITLFLG